MPIINAPAFLPFKNLKAKKRNTESINISIASITLNERRTLKAVSAIEPKSISPMFKNEIIINLVSKNTYTKSIISYKYLKIKNFVAKNIFYIMLDIKAKI